ncbi:Cation-transporting ATPase [Fasciolopsis buskii]|uniref:Cation-transporting ATPase n=1 Tax=Fasciolopsis buskii TaxID=27845 RepID=A0A8E0RTW3_9TREM|nr:Cation-transporting ATPase [Fasciolopsis buski]
MAMTVGVVFAQRRLRSQDIHCIHPSVINVCGVLNVVCFDKTGTLTEDGLNLWGVIPSLNGRFADPQFEPSELPRGPLLESMAACHSLTLIENVLSGDPLDLQMFQSTKWVSQFINQLISSLIRAMGAYLPSRYASIDFIGISQARAVSILLFSKNVCYVTFELKVPSDFHSVLLEYTREGYRVLALAWRPLKTSYTRMLKINRERAEQGLLFLGLLVMENRLKPESAPVIRVLRNANIRPVMVTGRHFCSSGDNMLTAVSVARDCEMIDELDRIVIVSAKPPSTSSTAIINPSTTTQVPSNGNSQNGTEVGFVANRFTTSSAAYGLPAECLPEQNSEPLVEFHYAEDLHKPVTEVTTTDGVSSRHWQTHDRRTTAHVLPGLRRDKRPKIGWPRRHAQHSIA